ncbi:MAG: urea carboxylase-associated family protein [Rhizobiaceae bacterium]
MKLSSPYSPTPPDSDKRKAVKPVVCYPVDTLPPYNPDFYKSSRENLKLVDRVLVAPRDAETFEVPAGHFFRIICPEGPQVGDLNLWNMHDLNERFFSGKTRALHGTHLSTGDRMWSNLPSLRPMATITYDTLDWYGFDEFGGSVHDVIGTRCDPYTNVLLSGNEYHYCCHSNLTRALASSRNLGSDKAEALVHDVLNVFMCTGFTLDTHQYFMKASPVRKGDYLEFFAEIDLLGGLSACPGGDCSTSHSSEEAQCYPLLVETYKSTNGPPTGWKPAKVSTYSKNHGTRE